jgi:N-acetylneuraminic acid mutarotase
MITGTARAGLAIFVCCFLAGCTRPDLSADGGKKPSVELVWGELAPLPDPEGFGGGFVGVSHGALLFAGGANFPGVPVWEGGKKAFYDSIFVLETPSGSWKKLEQTLPHPLAYGVSASHGEKVICVGGEDGERARNEVFSLEWTGGRAVIESLPPLPRPCTYGCGGLLGDHVYIAAGVDEPPWSTQKEAFRGLWRLDLGRADAAWEELPPWPGPERFEAAAALVGGSFYLFSGLQMQRGVAGDGKPGITTRLLVDAYRFTLTSSGTRPVGRWERVRDLPRGAAGAASPAPILSHEEFLLAGGWDERAVSLGNRGQALLAEHPGVTRECSVYHRSSDSWTSGPLFPDRSMARVTMPTTWWGDRWVMASGEARPGVRSPRVFTVRSR